MQRDRYLFPFSNRKGIVSYYEYGRMDHRGRIPAGRTVPFLLDWLFLPATTNDRPMDRYSPGLGACMPTNQ